MSSIEGEAPVLSGRPAGIPGVRVGWRIFSLIASFALVVYFQQRSLTIAAARIMPELHLSQMQVGWLQWALVLAYTVFQFPGGLLGQRLGSRATLGITLSLAVAATLAVPALSSVLDGGLLYGVLLVTQFVLGMAQGPFMPVCAGVMQAWLPERNWALAQGLHTLSGHIGNILAPPLLAALTVWLGWRSSLFWAALPPIVLIAIWIFYARDTPAQHPAVSAAELADLAAAPTASPIPAPRPAGMLRQIGQILTDADILRVTVSYVFMNFMYYLVANWCFLYLVQELHFRILEGGVLASLPPIGAAAGGLLGGIITAACCRRFGSRWGYRLVPLVALPLGGIALYSVAMGPTAYVAVGILVFAFFAIELCESSYWAGMMQIARTESMAACGVMNCGGNVGGLIGIPIVAWLSGHQAWKLAFFTGAACSVCAAGLWLFVDASGSPKPTQAGSPMPASEG